jgi:hypothetical protein
LYCYAAIATGTTIYSSVCAGYKGSIATGTTTCAATVYDKATGTRIATIAICSHASCLSAISTVTAARDTAPYDSTTITRVTRIGDGTDRIASVSSIPAIGCTVWSYSKTAVTAVAIVWL